MQLPSIPWDKFSFKFQMPGKAMRVAALLLLLGLSGYIYYLDTTIREAFEGRKFALPRPCVWAGAGGVSGAEVDA